VAVSADGVAWFLLNVAPDVRQQILAFAELGPPEGRQRGTGIAGCVLTDAELDHVTGLLLLREGPPVRIVCTSTVRHWLGRSFPIEPMLARFANPSWTELTPLACQDLCLPDGTPSGLDVCAFDVGRHVPRYVIEDPPGPAGLVVGLRIRDQKTGGSLLYAPCVEWLPLLTDIAEEADGVLLDGTFWTDDEPVRFGIGSRTARDMGHVPVSGLAGSLGWLAALPARERVYIHVNNTNPMLNEAGPEHRAVIEAGVRVARDGDSFDL
jgi:pyrroloquinoline quinone biosynthesis protein B